MLTTHDLIAELDAPPDAICTGCGRKSWGEPIGKRCGMIQPSGFYCAGIFVPIQTFKTTGAS